MDELLLKKLSLFAFIIGFAGIFLLFFFKSPIQIDNSQTLPKDSLFQSNITIIDAYPTESGFFITFSRDVTYKSFFDGNASFLKAGDKAIITGSLNGDFLSIKSIEKLS